MGQGPFNDELEKDYGTLPEWAAHLQEVAPDFYRNYLALRGNVLKDGVLKRKEKELILVGVNAARRYRPSLIGHTRLAVANGATPRELAEAVMVGILSRGIPSWIEGRWAVEEGQRMVGGELYLNADVNEDKEENYPEWLSKLISIFPEVGKSYAHLRSTLLRDGYLSRLIKELILVGINLADGYHEGIELHVKKSRELGATDSHLVETALTVMLTAGIVAWFNIVPFLKDEK